ncbi:hypothetical protein RN001_001336 [Aquatica leii]|uniref:Uncharacterized protein n=1 Tax=Aquatica leii TaxID=1421715 RepID=A0AAN7QAB3_9COLE|nr:hypothetical protein RN001_001336 [Aquatica leii]
MFQNIVFIFLTVILIKSINMSERECSENDVQCLKKKEEMHWCSDQGCSTCTDHNCIISCKGFSCGLCPNGSCCDGIKCNVCYNNTCCGTIPCNYCVHTCKHACNNTLACEKICVPQCQNSKHDIFVIPSATHKRKASVYIKGLAHNGSGDFHTMNKTILVSIHGKNRFATILKLWGMPTENYELKNCTVSNINVCSKQNKTKCIKECQLKCQIDCNKHCSGKCNKPKPQEDSSYYSTLTPGCCHVVHPQVCYNTYSQSVCYKRSHRECSKMCTSKFIHIVAIDKYLHYQYNRCFYVQVYPYIYCGQYVIQNCDSCYVCNGKYNPSHCGNDVFCNNECRKNFLPYRPKKPQNKKNTFSFKSACSQKLQYQNAFGYFPDTFGFPFNHV